LRLPIKAREIPVRVATGAFILNSGLGKAAADEETAAQLHGFASGTYPPLKQIEPAKFASLLSKGEIALGVALLAPIVPTFVAGAALTAFSGGLLGLYLRTPGMRKPGSLAPTQQGLPVSKDVWMLGAGIGLMVDALTDRTDKRAKKRRRR
jgi:hypothetical protein